MVKRIGKKLMIYLVILAMVLTFAPLAVFAGDDNGAVQALVLNQAAHAKPGEGQTNVIFSFTAPVSGKYAFESSNNGGYDPYGELYSDQELNDQIAYNDDGASNSNFKITETLTAGQTYWLLARTCSNSSEFEYDVTVYQIETVTVKFHANHQSAYFEGEWNDDLCDYEHLEFLTEDYETGSEIYMSEPLNTDDNMSFAGWAASADAEEPVSNITAQKDLELFAVWKELVDVEFNTNNKDAHYNIYDEDLETYVNSEKTVGRYRTGSGIDAYSNSYFEGDYQDKWKFMGWSENPNAAEPDQDIVVRAGLKLYGVWKQICKVTYNATEGYFWNTDNKKIEETCDSGSRFDPDYIPENTNFLMEFDGWYDKAEGGNKYDENTTITDDVEVFAHWKSKGDQVLPLNQDVTVKAENSESVWYSFTPSETGTYKIISFDNGDYDYYPYVKVYNSKGEYIAEGTGGGEDGNLKKYIDLTAGETYVFEFRDDYYNDDFIYKVKLTKPEIVKVSYNANHEKAYFEGEWDSETGQYKENTSCEKIFEVGEQVTSEEQPLTKDNSIEFLGWATSPDADKPEKEIEAKAGLEVYAVWEELIPVTFYSNYEKAFVGCNYDYQTGITNYLSEETLFYRKGDTLDRFTNDDFYGDYQTEVRFDGWSENQDAASADDSIPVREGLKLYGVWKEVVPIIFHADNEIAHYSLYDATTGQYVDSDTVTAYYAPGDIIYQYAQTTFLGDYYDKYSFKGWSETENAETPDSQLIARKGMELHAVWKPYYEVSYDANGGYVNGSQTTTERIEKGASFDVLLPEHENKRMAFEGWFTEDGTKADETTIINGPLAVKARWKELTDATLPEKELTDAASEVNKIIFTFTPSSDGTYVFNTADTKQMNPTAVLCDQNLNEIECKDLAVFDNVYLSADLKGGQTYWLILENQRSGNFSYKVKLEKVVTAKLTFKTERKDTYFLNGEQKVQQLERTGIVGDYLSNAGVPAPNTDDVSGMVGFVGWTTDPEKGNVESPESLVRENTTYYAVWVEKTPVTFHANKEKASFDDEESITVSYDKGSVLDDMYIETPEIDDPDLVFAGWADKADADKPNIDLNVAKADDYPNVYAVWRIKGHDITDIKVGETKPVNYLGAPVRFRFIPEEDGFYVLESSEYTHDPYGYLLDADENRLLYSDDDGESWNFKLGYELKKGETYYYDCCDQGVGTYNVSLRKVEKVTVKLDSNNGNDAWFETTDGKKQIIDVSLEKGSRFLPYQYDEPLTNDSGKLFAGWAREKDANQIDEEIYVTENTTLYAVWKDVATITFNVNRPDGKAWLLDEDYNRTVKTERPFQKDSWFYTGNSYVGYGLSDDSFTFLGWSKDPNATKPDENWILDKDEEVYAVWADYLTVTYDANGGFFPGKGVIVAKKFIPETTFENFYTPVCFDKTKTFLGWATTPDATKPDVIPRETLVDGLDVVYAVYAETIQLTYNANGGFFNDDPDVTAITAEVAKGSSFVSKYWPENSNPNLEFAGWFDKAVGGNQVTSETILNKDTTVYAQWMELGTLTLDANGGHFPSGEETILKTSFLKGQKISFLDKIIPVPSDDSVTFAGWFDAKTDGKQYTADSILNEDTTLYARWKSKSVEAEEVKLDKKTATLAVGKTLQLNAEILPPETTDMTLKWTSSNPKVLTVSSKGLAKGVGTGAATVTVSTANGKTATCQFKVTKALTASMISLKTTSFTYSGSAKKPAVTVTDGSKKLVAGTDYTVSYSNNINAGTATVTVKAKGGFYTGSAKKNFKINPKKVTPSVKLSVTKYVYDGKVKKPKVTVTADKKTLTASDYTATYSTGRKNVGKYSVKITLKGNYSGVSTSNFTIVPKGTTISGVTAAVKGLTAKWNKQTAQTSGYQIQYSTSKTFASGNNSKLVSGNAKTSLKITGLKAKTTYYVRIRTYKTVNGTKYYSSWSGAKAIKTK